MVKKKKTFSKKELFHLYSVGNYKKVISKIKQFNIEGLSEDEINKIYLDSLKKLALNEFSEGDIQRAIRDIDNYLVKKSDDEDALFLKLKFLAYLERFDEAYKLAKKLLERVKDNLVKKEVIFYYLVVSIYKDNSFDKTFFKKLPKSKQNYILFLEQFFKNNLDEALKYLDECKAKPVKTKKNIQAIKAILSNIEFKDKDIKPLYRLLLFSEDENLQNTKGVRENIKKIKNIYKINKIDRVFRNFLDYNIPINFEDLKLIYNQTQDIKIVFNNIALLIDKENYPQALDQFIYFKNRLVNLVESFFLLAKLELVFDNGVNNDFTYNFFVKYLKLHKEKFSNQNLAYLFYIFYKNLFVKDTYNKNIQNAKNLANEFNLDFIPFIIYESVNIDQLSSKRHIKYLNQILSSYTKLNEELLNYMKFNLNQLTIILDMGIFSEEQVENKLKFLLEVLLEIEIKEDRFYIKVVEIFDAICNVLLKLEVSDNSEKLFNSVYKRFKKYCKNDKFKSIQALKSYFENKIDYNFAIPEIFDKIFRKSHFDEKIQKEIEYFYGEFKLELKEGNDPLKVLTFDYDEAWYWVYDELVDYPFVLMYQYDIYIGLNDDVIRKIFKFLNINLKDFNTKKRLLLGIRKFNEVEFHKEISFKITSFLVELYKHLKSMWYLELIYEFLILFERFNIEKSVSFYYFAELFCKIQQKYNYKNIQQKYQEVLKMLNNTTFEQLNLF